MLFRGRKITGNKQDYLLTNSAVAEEAILKVILDYSFSATVVCVIDYGFPVGFCFSALFPDVVNCMQTDNLELKKLVYLYLMNYAKSQPDMAIMAVNTFVKVLNIHAKKSI